jgi:microcompartment protein CcmL/EutN
MARNITTHPALGLIETATILAGIEVADALVKRAEVLLHRLFTLTPGKMIAVFAGDEAVVEESYRRGCEVAGGALLDSLLLPGVEPRVAEALLSGGVRCEVGGQALGAVETQTIAACVLAADAALKAAGVALIEMRLRRELGGKGYFLICGAQEDVEAALAAAAERLAGSPKNLCGTLIIPRPHEDMLRELLAAHEATAWS